MVRLLAFWWYIWFLKASVHGEFSASRKQAEEGTGSSLYSVRFLLAGFFKCSRMASFTCRGMVGSRSAACVQQAAPQEGERGLFDTDLYVRA